MYQPGTAVIGPQPATPGATISPYDGATMSGGGVGRWNNTVPGTPGTTDHLTHSQQVQAVIDDSANVKSSTPFINKVPGLPYNVSTDLQIHYSIVSNGSGAWNLTWTLDNGTTAPSLYFGDGTIITMTQITTVIAQAHLNALYFTGITTGSIFRWWLYYSPTLGTLHYGTAYAIGAFGYQPGFFSTVIADGLIPLFVLLNNPLTISGAASGTYYPFFTRYLN